MQLQRSRTDVARSLVGATGQVSPGARCSPWRELHQSLGNHRIQRLLQAKLGVSHPDDIYERQVHRVADEVMRMPEPAGLWAAFGSSSAPARIQRLCAECEEGLQRQMPMEEEQPLVQGKREGAGLEEGAAAIEPYVDGLAARGEPLAPGTRAFFEPRFAADFSAVRIHTGPEADRSAAAIDALAYTAGDHIVFRAGRYDPTSLQGKHLLAHELTHVIQQGGATGAFPSIQRDGDDKPKDKTKSGEKPEEKAPAWSRKHTRGPRLLEGKSASYQVWFNHVLPPVPKGATQLWQVVESKKTILTGECKLETETSHLIDVVNIGKRTDIEDSWGWIPTDEPCFAIEVSQATVGFDDQKSNYEEQTSVNATKDLAQKILGKMSQPKGTYAGTYTFVKGANCKDCSDKLKEQQDKVKAPKGEALTIDGVGSWTS